MGYTTTWGRNSTKHVPTNGLFFPPGFGGVVCKQGSRVCTCASAVSRECLIACACYKRHMGTGFMEESRSSMSIEKVRDSVLWKSRTPDFPKHEVACSTAYILGSYFEICIEAETAYVLVRTSRDRSQQQDRSSLIRRGLLNNHGDRAIVGLPLLLFETPAEGGSRSETSVAPRNQAILKIHVSGERLRGTPIAES